jgi:uncharacterized protein YyaL (SSP411 family)
MKNRLIHATSPYLLQHAHNPVDWYEWGEEALTAAKDFSKPILLSIGYAACHWCHVMERECFEDEETAALMNDFFICIKLDREERPDIDAICMNAVQALGISGGWPLNIFLTPDGKPFYGGTYFPRRKWQNLLFQIAETFQKQQREIYATAIQITEHLAKSELKKLNLVSENDFSQSLLNEAFEKLKEEFDRKNGGFGSAPKFPMPCLLEFLLQHTYFTADKSAEKQLFLTLDKMQAGGIFDQAEGGFSRYSVDNEWIVPHFEKMLYDNAQLAGLYAQAFAFSGKETYRRVAEQTLAFLCEQLSEQEGAFFSAFDADSEGVEGKYYTENYGDILHFFDENDKFLAAKYFSLTPEGNFEHKNILTKPIDEKQFCEENLLSESELREKTEKWRKIIQQERKKRVRPALDDKIISGWNALTVTALCKAYRHLSEDFYLKKAISTANFLCEKMLVDNQLFRTGKKGKAKIPAFAEDYAALIEALIILSETTGEAKWAIKATELTEFCLEKFYDTEENFFFFTSKDAEKLFSRHKEIFDNVIPSSNAVMAENLLKLGHLFSKEDFLTKSAKMCLTMAKIIENEPRYVAKWASVYALHAQSIAEAKIEGAGKDLWRKELSKIYAPNILWFFEQNSTIEKAETILLFCQNFTCLPPANSLQEARNLLEKNRFYAQNQ